MPDIQMTPGDRNPRRYSKRTALSAAVVALVAAGASNVDVLHQFLQEKEGERLVAYYDGARIPTICEGLTRIPPFGPGSKPVTIDMRLTKAECEHYDRMMEEHDLEDARSIIRKDVWERMSPASQSAAGSFVHNFGKAKAASSTYIRELNAGHFNEACAAITLWIKDGGRDCRKAGGGCQGQPIRRMQEDDLCLGVPSLREQAL